MLSLRHVFKYNNGFYINYDPENKQFKIEDLSFGLVTGIDNAEIFSYRPQDWILLEEKYKVGKILQVYIAISAVDC